MSQRAQTFYWSLSGTDIELSDFSDGSLTGSGTVGSDGTFLLNIQLLVMEKQKVMKQSISNYFLTLLGQHKLQPPNYSSEMLP